MVLIQHSVCVRGGGQKCKRVCDFLDTWVDEARSWDCAGRTRLRVVELIVSTFVTMGYIVVFGLW